jgi:hypothetical protein
MTAKIKLNAASGGGSFSIQAPSSSSNNRVITLPDTDDFVLSNKPSCVVQLTNNTNHSGNPSVVPFDEKDGANTFDLGGCFNATSSTATLNGISVPAHSFAPNVAGYYLISCTTTSKSTTSGSITQMRLKLFKNTVIIGTFLADPKDSDPEHQVSGSVATVVQLNGTGDYVQLMNEASASAGTLQHLGGEFKNRFSAFKLII